jgi:hypothetical protein
MPHLSVVSKIGAALVSTTINSLAFQNAITAEGKADYHDENLDDLARHDLNGRQVGTCSSKLCVHTLTGSSFRSGMSSGQRMPWHPRKGL